MIILISTILSIVDGDLIVKYLGKESGLKGLSLSVLLGSVNVMPGFVAFPLAKILLDKGVTYMTLAAFTNSLMMVGIVTFHYEKTYMGVKAALLRNFFGLIISLLVAVAIGFFYGEII